MLLLYMDEIYMIFMMSRFFWTHSIPEGPQISHKPMIISLPSYL